MTPLLVTLGAVFFAYAIYLGALCLRHEDRASAFVDAGLSAPGWTAIFGGTGVVIAAFGLHDHLLLVSTYGLQASHVAVGLVLVALTGALVGKRVWLAARMTGSATAGELAGAYYGSVALRLVFLGVLFLFSVPLAASWLGELGDLVEAATSGGVPRDAAIWTTAFFLFLSSALGGWRATLYVVGAQGLVLLVLLVAGGGFAALSLDRLAFLAGGIGVPQGMLADRIPGVMQFGGGIGKAASVGGPWTAVAILSFAIGLTGIVLSPGFAFLGITTSTQRGFAFQQVWMTAGLAAGLLLLLGPVLAAELAEGGYAGLAGRLAALDPLFGVAFVLTVAASLQIGVSFFAASGAHVATIELVHRYLLPGLDPRGVRLAARITLGIVWLSVAAAASATPLAAAILATLALPLAAQLLPAHLGLCWLPWLSRSAVLTGFVIGGLIVVFTEPVGLIAFEGLFVDLPWGRWPLTVHSAAWGLVFNVGFCLLAAIFTRKGPERERRMRLHEAFAARHRIDFGGPAGRGAKWSLTLIWAFLALGPGAILGNAFFSQPVFAGTDVALGLPSLLVWQLFFWLVGVLLVWWLAYQTRLSVLGDEPIRRIDLADGPASALTLARPPWITRLLGRVTGRP